MTVDPNSTANVSSGKGKATGYAFTAPAATTLPEDATSALNAAFVNLGYLNEDGIVNSQSFDTVDFPDMNGDVIYTEIKSREESVKIVLVETTINSLKEVFGDGNVTSTGSGANVVITAKGSNTARVAKPYVFETVLANGKVQRVVIPLGKVISVGDITYTSGELISYELEIKCLTDASGYTSYRYIATPTSPSPASSG